MQKNLVADNIFNAQNYYSEVRGIRVYITDKVDPGQVVEGKTYEQKEKRNMFIEVGNSHALDLTGLKKITHLAVHPQTSKFLLERIEDEYKQQRS